MSRPASRGVAAPSTEEAIRPYIETLARASAIVEERFRVVVSRPHLILDAAGMQRDEWQESIIGCRDSQILILGARQGAGKSTAVAGRAVAKALQRKCKIYIGGPKEDQSKEVLEKAADIIRACGWAGPIVAPGELQTLSIRFRSGSKIAALSGSPTGIRGKTADEVIITEAALASDKYIAAFSPSRGVTGGALVLESTPFGKQGTFWRAFNGDAGAWTTFRRPWQDCPRLTAQFIKEERERNPLLFKQELALEFLEDLGALFSTADIEAAFETGIRPMVFNAVKSSASSALTQGPLVVPMPEDRSMFEDVLS